MCTYVCKFYLGGAEGAEAGQTERTGTGRESRVEGAQGNDYINDRQSTVVSS